MKKSAFTLVEILIVVVLFGLLSGIILKTYTTITKVAFRMEQDKELAKETLVLSQVLQNIAAEATIDYSQDQEFALLGTGKFLQSKMQFKVIPYAPALESLKWWTTGAKPWFWILGAVYSPFYDPQKRSNSSILPIQLFFGLHGATPNLYELKETSDED